MVGGGGGGDSNDCGWLRGGVIMTVGMVEGGLWMVEGLRVFVLRLTDSTMLCIVSFTTNFLQNKLTQCRHSEEWTPVLPGNRIQTQMSILYCLATKRELEQCYS